MIAKELHADNVYSASQISRKLKQLGLQVPRSKRTSNAKDSEQNEIEDSGRSERTPPERVQKRRWACFSVDTQIFYYKSQCKKRK